MKWGRTAKQSAITRRSGRRVAMLAVLVLAVSGAFSNVGSASSIGAAATLAPLAAHRQVRLKPPSERIGAWADGAIDSFEENDPSCEPLALTPAKRTESLASCDSRVPRLASGELARPRPARGPPSA